MSICAPKPFGSKFLKGGYSYWPLWWYGQKSKLHDMSGHGVDLTPSGAYFNGQGYYFDGSNDYLADAGGRKVLEDGTAGLWHSVYLTEGTVSAKGSIWGTGTKIYLNTSGASPKITGKIVFRPAYCPNLEVLRCYYNSISILEVKGLPSLYFLACAFNSISTLDVSNSSSLTFLSCAINSISILDVSDSILIKTLLLQDNSMDQDMVDTVLCDVNNYGTSNGTLNISNNAAPSATGMACKDSLVSRGWDVTTD